MTISSFLLNLTVFIFAFILFFISPMCLVVVIIVVIVVDDDVVAFVSFVIKIFNLPTSFYRLLSVPPLLFMYPMLLSAEFLYKFQIYMLVCVNLIMTFFITIVNENLHSILILTSFTDLSRKWC